MKINRIHILLISLLLPLSILLSGCKKKTEPQPQANRTVMDQLKAYGPWRSQNLSDGPSGGASENYILVFTFGGADCRCLGVKQIDFNADTLISDQANSCISQLQDEYNYSIAEDGSCPSSDPEEIEGIITILELTENALKFEFNSPDNNPEDQETYYCIPY